MRSLGILNILGGNEMTFRTYITVKGEVKTYPKYHNKRSAAYHRIKCPVCGLLCLTVFHKKFGDRIHLGYICNAHTPPHVYIDSKYKIFDVDIK